MSLLEQEIDTIVSNISQELSATPFACSSLTRLTNGTTNFVFRGELTKPISVGGSEGGRSDTTTVIIKYAAPYAAVNKNLAIDASRAVCIFLSHTIRTAHTHRARQRDGDTIRFIREEACLVNHRLAI